MSGTAGSASDLTLTLTNSGTADIEGAAMTRDARRPAGRSTSIRRRVTVPAGKTVKVVAHVTPSSDAIAGDYVATFKATAPVANAMADIRVTIQTSLLWGIVGIGLIALVLHRPVVDLPAVRPPMSEAGAPTAADAAAPTPREPTPAERRRRRPEPVIRTRRLTKKYGTLTAVDRLDLAVYPGEIFGLLGQNGAGKTTTILMLLGLSEPTDGEASVMGLDPAWEPREVKRRVGYLPDAVGFYENMTGRQNLRYTARLNGLRKDEAETAIDEVLAQVGLADRADDRVGTYSRGMRQRLGIADALVKSPDLLILDEPTTSIDPIGVVEILELLRRLVERARPVDHALQPPAEPGPVRLRPDRDLRGRPPHRGRDRRRARDPVR